MSPFVRHCFNPTLVRLRRLVNRGVSLLSSRFNPTLVRLRPSDEGRPDVGFQGFNPTLVRLRRLR